jgi:ABC-type lipoprotein export system ATPase subunit
VSAETNLAIHTEQLWRVYPCRTETGASGVPALRGIGLQVEYGQFVVLRGRSGSGKTTMLNCLAGLDRPTSGEISVLGRNLKEMSDQELTVWRRGKIGLVFQSFGLIATLSAYENVELLLRIMGADPAESHRRTLEVLDLVGLNRWRNHRPYEMSGGQQQRVAIARALANRAQLILADEPTGELDSKTANEILGFFRDLVENSHLTVLMASHDPLVDRYAGRVLNLKDGMLPDTDA